MNIADVKIVTSKFRGGIRGFAAILADLTTEEKESKEAAKARLTDRIMFRASYESTRVHIVSMRGHVGVFSYELQGYVRSQHVWPDGHVAVSVGANSMKDAEDSFRYHVAQLTWNGAPYDEADLSGIPSDNLREYRSWIGFQRAYRHALDDLKMSNGPDTHEWAFQNREQFA